MKHNRLPLLFVIALFVLVAILASGFFLVWEWTTEKQLMAYGQMTLEGAVLYVDTMMEAAKDILDNIYLDADVSMLLNRQNVSASELLSGLRRLEKYVSSSYFIDSIYIYNRLSGTVYVSSPHMPEAVYPLQSFPDFDAASLMEDYAEVKNMEPVFRAYNTYYPSIQAVPYISFIRYNTLSRNGESNVIMVNLRQDILSDLIPNGESSGGAFLLCDLEGGCQLVAGLVDEVSTPAVDEIRSRIEKEDEAFISKVDGRKFIVCSRDVLGGNARLAFAADEDEIASITRAGGYASSIILLALSFAAILVLSIFFLRHIWKSSKEQLEAMRRSDEEKKALKEANRRGRILSLLHSGGDVADEAFEDCDGSFVILLVAIDRYQEISSGERASLKTRILEGFGSALGKASTLFSVYEDDERCVLGLGEDVQLESIEAAKAKVEKDCGVSLTLLLSEPMEVDDIQESYEYLSQSLSYRLLLGPGRLITPAMLEEQELTGYEIADGDLKSLAEAIMNLDTEKALSILDCILSRIASASYRSSQLCIVSLAVALDDTFNRLLLNNGIELPVAISIIHRVPKLESIWQLKTIVGTMLEMAEQAIASKSSNRQGELVAEIVRLTKENYNRQDFSINTVADAMGMNASYLGRVFKKATGSKFTEFVLSQRMEEACHLLSASDEPIDMIVYRVGFSDTPYFYKLFKKLNGCTPLRYRQENSRKEGQ